MSPPEPAIRIITDAAMAALSKRRGYPYPVGAYPTRKPELEVVISESTAAAAIERRLWARYLIRHEKRHLDCPTWAEFQVQRPGATRAQWEHIRDRVYGHPWAKPKTLRGKAALIFKQVCHAFSPDCLLGINAFTRYLRLFDWSPPNIREREEAWVRREVAIAWHKYRRPRW